MTRKELKLFSDNYDFIINRCLYIVSKLDDSLECEKPCYAAFEISFERNEFQICYYDLFMEDHYWLYIPIDEFLGDIDSFIKNFKASVHK